MCIRDRPRRCPPSKRITGSTSGYSARGAQLATTSELANLRARWTTAEGSALATEVFRRLVRNRDLAPIVDRHDGRLDLRGIRLLDPTASSKERNMLRRVFRLDRTSAVTQVRKATLANIDLSYAELPHIMFMACEIRNCRFQRANVQDGGLWGCRVTDTSFEGANLRSVVLGGAEYPPTPYERVSFASADLRDAVPGSAASIAGRPSPSCGTVSYTHLTLPTILLV